MGKIKNKKTIIILSVLLLVVIGVTIAYFSNSDIFDNIFNTKPYGSTYTEEFVSPDNWLPGDVTDKTVEVENTGDVDQAVRISYTESWSTHNNGTLNGWIHSDGTKSTHTTETELSTDERAAVINFANTDDWTKVGDYYYYNYKLAPNDKTSSFIESVTFNPLTKLDDTCTETNNNGVKTISCSSSGDDYDNAAYTLTLTIETVQYNKYNEAWNLNNSVTIAADKPISGVQSLLSKVNPKSIINYTDGDIHEMYTFEHEATEQTDSLTDYRYIGNDPYNYVYFNCDDLSNQNNNTCEVWRIIGVFSVDNGNNKYENRIKIVRGSLLPGEDMSMPWNSGGENDWTNASLKNVLNNDYYNNINDLDTYGLKESTKRLVDDAKYYLGGRAFNPTNHYGTTNDIYSWERGKNVYSEHATEWIGRVALIYPSDQYMVYAKGVDETCYNDPYLCNNKNNASKGWIYNTNRDEENEITIDVSYTWLLSPYLDHSNHAFNSGPNGDLFNGYGYGTVNVINSSGVRPALYLSSSVKIIDGDGSSGNPYKLSL